MKYTKDDICAVVVTYNPEPILIDNLNSLVPQVGNCILFDNGSTNKGVLNRVKETFGCKVIESRENRGIAYALNRGADECRAQEKPLLLTMDQDTILNVDAVKELLRIMNEGNTQSVGINWDGKALADEAVSYLITSGNLVTMEAVDKVGAYDEKLFIDSVDFDFSLRMKDAGYRLIKVAKAKARHQLGEKQGESDYQTHSAHRYYYIYRNHFYLIKKYWKGHKLFCIKKQLSLCYDLVRIMLFDQERKKKLQNMKKGYLDSKDM